MCSLSSTVLISRNDVCSQISRIIFSRYRMLYQHCRRRLLSGGFLIGGRYFASPPPSLYMQSEITIQENRGLPQPAESPFSPSQAPNSLSVSLKTEDDPQSRPQFFHAQNGGKGAKGSRLANGGADSRQAMRKAILSAHVPHGNIMPRLALCNPLDVWTSGL